ncbi:hypothetical protein WJX73_000321 [Symbiochloris irregularis]|uniref:Uncharacterized protein n=1 Tax=Symbiochloris irregularis TaxID=706552 RepID=A0AAW1P553_9CHLO
MTQGTDVVSDSESEEELEMEESQSSGDDNEDEESEDDQDDCDQQSIQKRKSPSPDHSALRIQKEANTRAMLNGSLQVERAPLLPKVLSLAGAEALLRKPFKSPHPTADSRSQLLNQKLALRRKFVPWAGGSPLVQLPAQLPPPVTPAPPTPEAPNDEVDTNPLTLWEKPAEAEGENVCVDKMLTKWLRPHQREGVQFMFDCVTGLRGFEGAGCILADDMGLGKTLQGITLIWTLLRNGHQLVGGNPVAKRCIICCPTSLVSNWESECKKWLQGRLKTTALCEASREDVIASVKLFLSPANQTPVLIISYETFRLHAERFSGDEACDLLICDEAHRLKSDQTLTSKALDSLKCRRRVLLSGTPMQNHLDEFYAMVNFCNPLILGSPASFRKHFEAPILRGREPDATDADSELAQARSAELSTIVNAFILRRTNSLLSQHLPPKVIQVVCCKMTQLQCDLYCHFLESNITRHLLNADGKRSAKVLSAITSLKKLCNHPKLIYDSMHGKGGDGPADGFEGCERFFLPGMLDDGRAGRGAMAVGWEGLSGKFAVLACMLALLRKHTDDRIVIVSNYTQTLDLIATLCRERQYPFVRLDGSTSISKRQKLVVAFNDPRQQQFVFLLSSKAGGCGLNLVGGNRLVLFDPDWNPATDKQAAGRVWRDGQKKQVYVYRFLASGSIEEKVYQRQLSKEGLQSVVNSAAMGSGGASSNAMSTEELRDLFTLRRHTRSDTYDCICGDGDEAEAEASGDASTSPEPCANIHKEQVGAPAEEDLKSWGHHADAATIPDSIMRSIGAELPGVISFVFSNQVVGKPVEEPASTTQKKDAQTPATAAPGPLHSGRAPPASGVSSLPRPAQQPSLKPSRLSTATPRMQPLHSHALGGRTPSAAMRTPAALHRQAMSAVCSTSAPAPSEGAVPQAEDRATSGQAASTSSPGMTPRRLGKSKDCASRLEAPCTAASMQKKHVSAPSERQVLAPIREGDAPFQDRATTAQPLDPGLSSWIERNTPVLGLLTVVFLHHYMVGISWLWRTLILLAPITPQLFWDQFFALAVADLCIRLLTAFLKAAVLLVRPIPNADSPILADARRKQGRVLTFVEHASLLYRCCAPTAAWYMYFRHASLPFYMVAGCSGMYLFSKSLMAGDRFKVLSVRACILLARKRGTLDTFDHCQGCGLGGEAHIMVAKRKQDRYYANDAAKLAADSQEDKIKSSQENKQRIRHNAMVRKYSVTATPVRSDRRPLATHNYAADVFAPTAGAAAPSDTWRSTAVMTRVLSDDSRDAVAAPVQHPTLCQGTCALQKLYKQSGSYHSGPPDAYQLHVGRPTFFHWPSPPQRAPPDAAAFQPQSAADSGEPGTGAGGSAALDTADQGVKKMGPQKDTMPSASELATRNFKGAPTSAAASQKRGFWTANQQGNVNAYGAGTVVEGSRMPKRSKTAAN